MPRLYDLQLKLLINYMAVGEFRNEIKKKKIRFSRQGSECKGPSHIVLLAIACPSRFIVQMGVRSGAVHVKYYYYMPSASVLRHNMHMSSSTSAIYNWFREKNEKKI